MALFLVTDNALKDYVSEILQDGSNRQKATSLVLNAVKDWLQRFEIDWNSDYVFKPHERFAIIAILNKFVAPGDGRVVPAEFALQASMNFHQYDGTPPHILVSDDIVRDFLTEVHGRKEILIDNGPFKDYEMAFRLYFGHEKQGAKNHYSIVMVPICTRLLTVAGQKREHLLDLEKVPLEASGGFFALIMQENSAEVSIDVERCKLICANRDHGSDTELAFCTLEMFDKFRNGTDSTRRETMGVTLGRLIGDGNPITKDDPVTQIISFRDKKGEILQSKFEEDRVVFDGFCFDQTDLVPPPKPVTDPSF